MTLTSVSPCLAAGQAIFAVCLALAPALTAAEAPAALTAADQAGRAEARAASATVFGWQHEPLTNPKGGADRFPASAFVHPFCTPSGFDITAIQPADHLHHFGVWWPWKHVETGGKTYNTWEIQEKQGGLFARGVKMLESGPHKIAWECTNEIVIRPGGETKPVIRETAVLTISNMPEIGARSLDIRLTQKALAGPVVISAYRYSGFSWRGPLSWNKENSTMLTSEGHHRDNANGQPGRWVLVTGPTPKGPASVLLLSDATKLAGTPERLRVWDSKSQNGNPFVNFNPVVQKPLPLDDAHPAVSKRHYLVVAADRTLDAKAADKLWEQWTGK